jgi:mannose-6-phosphate isomerase-like protein (cupin superfamily)
MQLVLMSLKPKEEIGNEMHESVDQFFRIEMGEAKFVFNGKEQPTAVAGDAVIVPAGTHHNVINPSATQPLKLYTIYAPPNHRDGVIHPTRADAESGNESFDGKTS